MKGFNNIVKKGRIYMYNNYNSYASYYPQQQQASQSTIRSVPQTLGLKGRPVSSLEEARATSIDFDGSIFFFPDLANQKIYTKQINMDGTASLNMYELKEIPTVSSPNINTNFVTREEFEQALNSIQLSLNNLVQPNIEELEEPIKEDPPVSSAPQPTYKF